MGLIEILGKWAGNIGYERIVKKVNKQLLEEDPEFFNKKEKQEKDLKERQQKERLTDPELDKFLNRFNLPRDPEDIEEKDK